MTSHNGFDLYFFNDLMILSIFSSACWPFIYLWRIVYPSLQVHCSFLNWSLLLNCKNYLFRIQIPYHIYDFQIFSSVQWAFTFLMLSSEIVISNFVEM